MKSSIVIITLFFTTFIFSYNLSLAQEMGAIGPRMGLNIIPVGVKDDIDGKNYQLGNSVGGYGNLKLNKWLSIRAELYYTLKKKTYEYEVEKSSLFKTLEQGFAGSTIDLSSLDLIQQMVFINDTVYGYRKGKATLNYIELPISAVFSVKSWNIGIGAYGAFLVKARAKDVFHQEIPVIETLGPSLSTIPLFDIFLEGLFPSYFSPTTTVNDTKDPYKSFDWGLVGDVSYTFSNKINIGFRYSTGMMNYRKTELKKNDFHSYTQLSVGYNFGFKASKGPKAIYDIEDKPSVN